MFETQKNRWAIAAVCVTLAGAGACAKSGKPAANATTAERAEHAHGEMKRADTLRATVEAVDVNKRLVGLRDEEGHPFVVEVGDSVSLDKLEPGKKVKVTYQESIAFALQDPANEQAKSPETEVEEQSRRKVPEGVQFGRRVTTTVEIVDIAPEGATATFRVPEGDVRTVAIDDPKSREKIASMRPGDAVAVTYTEKLAVALDEE